MRKMSYFSVRKVKLRANGHTYSRGRWMAGSTASGIEGSSPTGRRRKRSGPPRRFRRSTAGDQRRGDHAYLETGEYRSHYRSQDRGHPHYPGAGENEGCPPDRDPAMPPCLADAVSDRSVPNNSSQRQQPSGRGAAEVLSRTRCFTPRLYFDACRQIPQHGRYRPPSRQFRGDYQEALPQPGKPGGGRLVLENRAGGLTVGGAIRPQWFSPEGAR